MSEWKEYKLGDIAEVQTGPFVSQLHMSEYKICRREPSGEEFIEYYGENTVRDQIDSEYSAAGMIPKYVPSRYDPILPKMYSRPEKINLPTKTYMNNHFSAFADSIISWRIYADNAPEQIGSIRIGDIKGVLYI
jgi:hypothetical protein